MSKKATAPSATAPDSTDLAWSLAEVTVPYLSPLERDRIYIAIGIGEAFSAVEALITAVARQQVLLGVDLVAAVTRWLDCHAGHDAEPRLRRLIDEVKTVSSQQESAGDQPDRHFYVSAGYSPGGVVHTQSENRAQEGET